MAEYTKKRAEDKFTNVPDHDLLIKHSVKLDNLCVMMRKNDELLKEFISKIDVRCETRRHEIQADQEKNMPSTTFWKMITILVVVLTAMIATMGLNRTVSLRNENLIKNNSQLIEKNGKMLNKLITDIIPDIQKH